MQTKINISLIFVSFFLLIGLVHADIIGSIPHGQTFKMKSYVDGRSRYHFPHRPFGSIFFGEIQFSRILTRFIL